MPFVLRSFKQEKEDHKKWNVFNLSKDINYLHDLVPEDSYEMMTVNVF